MSTVGREYLFFRHGEAGEHDALSSTGREQAARAGREAKVFRPELLFSSDLRRAKETAEIIARETNLPITAVDPDLNEVSPGTRSLEGLAFNQRDIALVSLAMASAYLFNRRRASHRPGESAPEVLARIQRVFQRLDQLPASRVLVVGHGYWIFTAALLVSPFRAPRRANMIEHCASTLFVRDANGTLQLRGGRQRANSSS